MRYLFVFLLVGLVSSCEDVYTLEEVVIRNNGDSAFLKKDMTPVTGIVEDNYANGKMKFTAEYKNGEAVGDAKYWHENGQLMYEANIKNRKNLSYKFWYENGQFMGEFTNEDGEINFSKCYDEYGNEMADCKVPLRNFLRKLGFIFK